MRSIVSGASADLAGIDLAEPACRRCLGPAAGADSGRLGLGGLQRCDFRGASARSSACRTSCTPLLAGHPRIDVEPESRSCDRKTRCSSGRFLRRGPCRATFRRHRLRSRSRQKIATKMPSNSSVQKMTPSSNLAISLK